MTIFEAAKSMVTPRMAAEHYGMTVAQNGMVCCPFHNDRHPSMKLNEDYFYCFGCGTKGDAIEFTSKLFGITAMEGEMISRNRASRKRAPAFPKSVHLHGFVNCPTVLQSRIYPFVARSSHRQI